MKNELVSISKLARILKVSVRWLRQETDANRIPHLQAGKDTLYLPDVVKAALAKRAANNQEGKDTEKRNKQSKQGK